MARPQPHQRFVSTILVLGAVLIILACGQVDYLNLPLITWSTSPVYGSRRDYSGELWYTVNTNLPGTTDDPTPQDIIIKATTEWVLTLTNAQAETKISSAHVKPEYSKLQATNTDTTITLKYLGTDTWTLGETLTDFLNLTIQQGSEAVITNTPLEFDLLIRLGDDSTPPAATTTVEMTKLPLFFSNANFGLLLAHNYDATSPLGQIFTTQDRQYVTDYINSLPDTEKPDPVPQMTTIILSKTSPTLVSLEMMFIPEIVQLLDPDGDTIDEVTINVELGQYFQLTNATTTEQPNLDFSTNFYPLQSYSEIILSKTTPIHTLVFDPADTSAGSLKLPSGQINRAVFRFSIIHPATKTLVFTTTVAFVIQPACIIPPLPTSDDYFNPKFWTNDSCSLTGARGCNYITGECNCRYNYSGTPNCELETDICNTVCSPVGTRLDWCESKTITADSMRTALGCICRADYQLAPNCSVFFSICQQDVTKCVFGAQIQDPVTKKCTDECYCLQKWEGTKCTECPVKCQNGGRLGQYSCDKCYCPNGYLGDECQCSSRTATLVINGFNDAIDRYNVWTSEDKDELITTAYTQTVSALNDLLGESLPNVTYDAPVVAVFEKDDSNQGNNSQYYGNGVFTNVSSFLTTSFNTLSSIVFQSSLSPQTLSSPINATINRTNVTFTFRYGCDDYNPTLSLDDLTALWTNLPNQISQHPRLVDFFTLEDPSQDQKSHVTILEKTKDTFPNSTTFALPASALILVFFTILFISPI